MCIFCKIINNEIPSYKIYEDEYCIAILDISQITEGHTLVIPKKHYENMFDIDEEYLVHVTKALKKVVSLYKENGIDNVNIINNSGVVSGQEVLHLHYHILPRYNKEEFGYKYNKTNFNLEEVYNKFK